MQEALYMDCLTEKVKALCSFKMSVPGYYFIWCNIPEDLNLALVIFKYNNQPAKHRHFYENGSWLLWTFSPSLILPSA
jgi:hypothetical protein